MIKNLKNVLVAFASLFLFTAPLVVPALAAADTQSNINNGLCAGSNLDATQTNACTPPDTSSNINKILSFTINIFSLIVGVISVIMIIIGGLRYITSGGEASNISSAKNTIIYAIVGLVIVALAQFIVHFVLNKVTQTA